MHFARKGGGRRLLGPSHISSTRLMEPLRVTNYEVRLRRKISRGSIFILIMPPVCCVYACELGISHILDIRAVDVFADLRVLVSSSLSCFLSPFLFSFPLPSRVPYGFDESIDEHCTVVVAVHWRLTMLLHGVASSRFFLRRLLLLLLLLFSSLSHGCDTTFSITTRAWHLNARFRRVFLHWYQSSVHPVIKCLVQI